MKTAIPNISKIAYDLVDSYGKCGTVMAAIDYVKMENPEADIIMLEAMWRAIDAYVDIQNFKSNFKNQ